MVSPRLGWATYKINTQTHIWRLLTDFISPVNTNAYTLMKCLHVVIPAAQRNHFQFRKLQIWKEFWVKETVSRTPLKYKSADALWSLVWHCGVLAHILWCILSLSRLHGIPSTLEYCGNASDGVVFRGMRKSAHAQDRHHCFPSNAFSLRLVAPKDVRSTHTED